MRRKSAEFEGFAFTFGLNLLGQHRAAPQFGDTGKGQTKRRQFR